MNSKQSTTYTASQRSEARQVMRFALIGGLATGMHVAVAGVVIAYHPALNLFVVNVLAFIVAFQVSFWGHRYVTFQRPGPMWRFLLVTLTGVVLNNTILAIVLLSGVLSGFAAVCVALVCVPIVVYVLSKVWVFSPSGDASRSP